MGVTLGQYRAIKAELHAERERSGRLEAEAADLSKRLAESYREKVRLDADLEKLEATREAEIDEALRRQAAAVIRRVELSDPLGPELGAVLALVPATRWLAVDPLANGRRVAWWRDEENRLLAHASGDTYEAAILAATAGLLGLDEASLRRRVSGSPAAVVKAAINLAEDIKAGTGHGEWITGNEQALIDTVDRLLAATADEPRDTCGSCARWSEGEPAMGGPSIARWCSRVAGYRSPDAWCSDHCSAATADTDPVPSSGTDDPPSFEGVTQPAKNLLRSEGDQAEDCRCSTCGEHVSPEIFVLLAGHCPSCGPAPSEPAPCDAGEGWDDERDY